MLKIVRIVHKENDASCSESGSGERERGRDERERESDERETVKKTDPADE